MSSFSFSPHADANRDQDKDKRTFPQFGQKDTAFQPVRKTEQGLRFPNTNPAFGQAKPQAKPVFGTNPQTPPQRPAFGNAFGSQPTTPPMTNRPSFGAQSQSRPLGTQPQAPRPTFGGTPQPQTSRPMFGGASQPQTPRPTFGGTPQPQTSRPTFGAQPTARPSFRPASSMQTPFQPQPSPLAATLAGRESHLSDEEFLLLRDFIYKQCGIYIAENRKYLVENRLASRIKDLKLKNYSEYYKYLKFDVNKDAELNKLFVLVTTNETSFFRNPPQLQVFQDIVLTDLLLALRQSNQRKLRIWSAGCSTGEEPYTLAIIISDLLRSELPSWDIKITANDLSTQVLQAARAGLYNEYSLRTTPRELVNKYFVKEGNLYKVRDELKRMINFSQINLSNREQLKLVERSHIVFCRNVIIYFDDDMKRKVINAFYDNLMPGGALLIGHSETLHNICRSFELEHHPGAIVYRKKA